MNVYDQPPACQKCGGSLRNNGDICPPPCNGRSQYRPDFSPEGLRRVAAALAEMDRRRVPPVAS